MERAAEEKIRLRKEKLEAWKRKKEQEEREKKEELPIEQPSPTSDSLTLETSVDGVDVKVETDSKVSPASGAAKPLLSFKPIVGKTGFSMGLMAKKKPTQAIVKKKPFLGLGESEEPKLQSLKRLRLIEMQDADDASMVALPSVTEAAEKANDKDDVVMDEAKVLPDGEVDILDEFMQDVHAEVTKLAKEDLKIIQKARRAKVTDAQAQELGLDASEEEGKDEDGDEDEDDVFALAAKKLSKKKEFVVVDHSAVNYEPFQKNFYVENQEFAKMTAEEIELMRAELDGIKIRGKDCPKPATKWSWLGLPPAIFEIIRRALKYEKPTPIQAQAIPAIMSGRDVIGIAKTGSGKTIAFLLPMFRHIKDQRPIEPGEGPIALIMTPTRELATQIYRECKSFTKLMGLRAVCAYGGSAIKDQIADLKRGAEIIICTPGRMIDLLCANNGRVTNLQRATYLVLDEADRMFDMGFEPQVMKIVNNVRLDRQTVLFSATFPRQMEALARKILIKPLEITVGGRSVVCPDVDQKVEVIEDEAKFYRLLEILGEWADKDSESRALIFVDRQEAADNLLKDLLRRGYPCQSMHGGKDQMDRDGTIASFKSGDVNILIATSVAARGLDVKQLTLVVNYDCPNHMEDYVHRCGRTGTSFTFYPYNCITSNAVTLNTSPLYIQAALGTRAQRTPLSAPTKKNTPWIF